MAGERVLELLEVVALRRLLADPDRARSDPERPQQLREPAGVQTFAAAACSPRAFVESVQRREQLSGGDRVAVDERGEQVGEEQDLITTIVRSSPPVESARAAARARAGHSPPTWSAMASSAHQTSAARLIIPGGSSGSARRARPCSGRPRLAAVAQRVGLVLGELPYPHLDSTRSAVASPSGS